MKVKVKRLGHVVMFNAVANSLKQQTETNENAVSSAQMQGNDSKKESLVTMATRISPTGLYYGKSVDLPGVWRATSPVVDLGEGPGGPALPYFG